MAVSENTYERITEILDKARAQAIELALSDTHPEKVYELMVQLFPLSEPLRTKRSVDK
jgi:hypothetical protein